MPEGSLDQRIRLEAFAWLESQCAIHGEVLPWALLLRGFDLNDQRVPLVSQQGIFKPRLCELPLTLRPSPDGPYHDAFGPDELLRYAYRGTNAQHRENVGLRRAMKSQAPLVYFHGLLPGKYLAIWPVYIVGDDPETLFFSVAVDDARYATQRLSEALAGKIIADPAHDEARRAYITTTTRRRVHQQVSPDTRAQPVSVDPHGRDRYLQEARRLVGPLWAIAEPDRPRLRFMIGSSRRTMMSIDCRVTTATLARPGGSAGGTGRWCSSSTTPGRMGGRLARSLSC